MGSHHLDRVLIDGGSYLNLVYLKTLRKMRILETSIRPNSTSFHRIVLYVYTQSLAHITVEVEFRREGNI
jgi:hypothetical protein